ncbi:MAG: hypothetical protein KO217_01120 [Methanobacteriaceae archaeon]|jgi:late competence protein required for DNA uptake (superfamily II DNA/RNA helicase)|nr:MAG: hypothetical protein CIT01_01520 [Methanobacterium sp. BRmetb2]MCC7557271.1 hypothetical protein [Methanobacteriaceae archaeon]
MANKIHCQSCGKSLLENEVYKSAKQVLCDDCYIDTQHRIKACNPLGERAKKNFRKSQGFQGTEGLSEIQKNIYQYIQLKEKVTRVDLIKQFKLSPTDLENHFAIMRQSQLVKGKKEGDTVYITLW